MKQVLSMTAAVIIFTGAVLFGISCKTKEPGRYYNKEKGFSIKFPAHWEIEEKYMGSDVLARVPVEGSVLAFRGNVNVIAENLSGDMNLDEYLSQQISSMTLVKDLIQNYTIAEEGKIEIDGCPAGWFVTGYVIANMKIKSISITTIRKNRGYVITGVFEDMLFGNYRKVFDEIAASFRFEQ